MADTLPTGTTIPVTYTPGETLTADSLNTFQSELLARILAHTHSGNTAADQQGVQLGAGALLDGAIESRHLSNAAVTTAALQDQSVTVAKLNDGLVTKLATLEQHADDTDVMLALFQAQIESLTSEVSRLAHHVQRLERAPHPTTFGRFTVLAEILLEENEHHNVKSVSFLRLFDVDVVDIHFRRRYKDRNYTVIATAEWDSSEEIIPVFPVVVGRHEHSVQLAFRDHQRWVHHDITVNFVIFGELGR